MTEDLKIKAEKIELLLLDCDGVLTDGKLYYSGQTEETKAFHVRDGVGLVKWRNAGKKWGVVTGRSSVCLTRRAEELRADYLIQNSINKLNDVKRIARENLLEMSQIAFIGDDEPDLEVIDAVGFGVAVADAETTVIEVADWMTTRPGGFGAVREVIEKILAFQRCERSNTVFD